MKVVEIAHVQISRSVKYAWENITFLVVFWEQVKEHAHDPLHLRDLMVHMFAPNFYSFSLTK